MERERERALYCLGCSCGRLHCVWSLSDSSNSEAISPLIHKEPSCSFAFSPFFLHIPFYPSFSLSDFSPFPSHLSLSLKPSHYSSHPLLRNIPILYLLAKPLSLSLPLTHQGQDKSVDIKLSNSGDSLALKSDLLLPHLLLRGQVFCPVCGLLVCGINYQSDFSTI